MSGSRSLSVRSKRFCHPFDRQRIEQMSKDLDQKASDEHAEEIDKRTARLESEIGRKLDQRTFEDHLTNMTRAT
mgnify:CR=1 FL=1